MATIDNVRRIVVEDFKTEDREVISKLASTLNPFMEDIVQAFRKNIDYENLTRTKISFDVSVDASGKPQGVSQINTGLTSYSGKIIIDVQPLVSASDVVLSTPYLDCTYQGNGVVRINRILGLPPGKKMRVVVEFIG